MTSKKIDLNIADKSIVIALLLWFFLGILGAHRFYMGDFKYGRWQLILSIIGFITLIVAIGYLILLVVIIWVLYDLVVIFRFFEGKPVGVISLRNKSTESEESNLDSLLKLHNLHEKGVLDKAEYEDRKRKILSSDNQLD
jgi:TM2 domain-containing membrane protein YozV